MYTIHKINGYTIIFIPNKTTVHINMCIQSGSMNETKHNAGIHHLVEHILTESWKPCGKQTCNSYWDKKGVSMNANTHLSYMNFYVNGLVEDFDEMMEYMTDIITKPFLTKSTLDIEKHAVLNELLILSNNPENKLLDAFHKEFFCDSVYSHDYDLQIKNLKYMTMKKIRDFYDTLNKEIVFVIAGPKMPKFKGAHRFKENVSCFTYSNKIIYVPYKQKSTILIIGLPVFVKSTNKLQACLQILHMILFQKLRVEMKMIYGISIKLEVLPAPHIIIKTTVETKHTPIVYKTIIDTFHKYKKEPFPQDYIDGMNKKNKLNYNNINFNSTFMANYILSEYLRGEIIPLDKKMKDIEKMKQKDFMNAMVVLDGCLVTYQGPKEIL